jgi:hypothetical protein
MALSGLICFIVTIREAEKAASLWSDINKKRTARRTELALRPRLRAADFNECMKILPATCFANIFATKPDQVIRVNPSILKMWQ